MLFYYYNIIMKYIYQCYFYVFVGLHSYYRRVTKCGPIFSSYELVLDYFETFKEKERNFCAGFIYEFGIDNNYRKLLYTTDPSIDIPECFSEKYNENNDSIFPNR